MDHRIEPLVADLVEWIAREPRPYQDVMDVWRTSCPRLTVWEDAVDRGYIEQRQVQCRGVEVAVTAIGLAFLAQHGRRMHREQIMAPVPA